MKNDKKNMSGLVDSFGVGDVIPINEDILNRF